MQYLMDWRGNRIEPGSIIVYPGRQSSSMWMIEAKVLEIVEIDHWGTIQIGLRVQPTKQGRHGRTNPKPVKITALERVTVLSKCDEQQVLTDEQVIAALIH